MPLRWKPRRASRHGGPSRAARPSSEGRRREAKSAPAAPRGSSSNTARSSSSSSSSSSSGMPSPPFFGGGRRGQRGEAELKQKTLGEEAGADEEDQDFESEGPRDRGQGAGVEAPRAHEGPADVGPGPNREQGVGRRDQGRQRRRRPRQMRPQQRRQRPLPQQGPLVVGEHQTEARRREPGHQGKSRTEDRPDRKDSQSVRTARDGVPPRRRDVLREARRPRRRRQRRPLVCFAARRCS
mmetsp:Transcript_14175/g.42873  ORF Transcript_14175/g.42873 Transcript_14175/m.42873 type:complete len:239 (+) Transcript_14175:285-1001(+)